jgi:phosphoribosyl 1,2-cyclic phosphodiesterase
MRFACLGSGSRGNAFLVECGDTTLMIDCGLSLKTTLERLARLGKTADSLSAILLTHEHHDHVKGVGLLARRFGLAVWMTPGTFRQCGERAGALPQVKLFSPHGAFEPSQFVLSNGAVRLGILTDTGSSTQHIEDALQGCDGLIVECNHDRDMLLTGPYPEPLKTRIAGAHGHLDNAAAAELLARVDPGNLQHIVAAHLSDANNTPALARIALSEAVGCTSDWIQVADQEDGLAWCALSSNWI